MVTKLAILETDYCDKRLSLPFSDVSRKRGTIMTLTELKIRAFFIRGITLFGTLDTVSKAVYTDVPESMFRRQYKGRVKSAFQRTSNSLLSEADASPNRFDDNWKIQI